MRNEKKYSWLSYTSFGLGGLSFVIVFSYFKSLLPAVLLPTVYIVVIGVPSSIVLGIMALRKKNEKRLLANIGITLGLLIGIFMSGWILFFWLITPVHPN